MRGRTKYVRVYKIVYILFCETMDDMMHDVMMMHKRKRTSNSNIGIFLGRYKVPMIKYFVHLSMSKLLVTSCHMSINNMVEELIQKHKS
jgi:hypothetical protein